MVGDVVLAPFPFTDLSQSKIRPAVIIAYAGNPRTPNWIMCEVTTSPRILASDITIDQSDMRIGTIRAGSRARTNQIMTLSESLFIRRIGHLTDAKTDEILAEVRGLF